MGAIAACVLATAAGGVAQANTSHEGWPKIDGALKINKDDGNETMNGTHNSDELLGGHDNDTIHGHFGRGSIDCGGGRDTLFISHRAKRGYKISHCERISFKTIGH
jgi:hypothetical protein